MNQTDLIQKIIAAEHQANQMTEEVKEKSEHIDASVEAESESLRKNYLDNAERYLARLEKSEQEKSAVRLKELDERLETKLKQVDVIYEARKDLWVQTIFERIIGKAGG